MLDNYILLQIKNLRNFLVYLTDTAFTANHNISNDDLISLDVYLEILEKSLT